MTSRVRHWTATLLVATGCAHHVAESPAATVPCAATGSSADAAWRTIAAERFTFCLPPRWRVSGHEASLGSATLRWGTGEHPREVAHTERVVVSGSSRGAPPVPTPPETEVQRGPEVIGGKSADVWHNHFGAAFYVGAQWQSPRVWLVGDAGTSDDADAVLAIIRTARFPTP